MSSTYEVKYQDQQVIISQLIEDNKKLTEDNKKLTEKAEKLTKDNRYLDMEGRVACDKGCMIGNGCVEYDEWFYLCQRYFDNREDAERYAIWLNLDYDKVADTLEEIFPNCALDIEVDVELAKEGGGYDSEIFKFTTKTDAMACYEAKIQQYKGGRLVSCQVWENAKTRKQFDEAGLEYARTIAEYQAE
jgi:hypothetical protein